eukprot:tig00000670_g3024.t1
MSVNALHFAIRLLWRDNLIAVAGSASGHPPLVEERDAEAAAGEPPGWPPEDLRLDFHHQLVKETVYSATAHSLRKEVHRRYAEHLEKLDGATAHAKAASALAASLFGVARLLARLARLGGRAAADAAADGRGLPPYAADRDCREVALDCLLLVMWINMRKGRQGGPQQTEGGGQPQARGFELAAFAIARCVEVSCATPKHLRTTQDARILSTFSTFLDIVGMSKAARGVLQRAREHAVAVGDDTSRAFVASHTAMQACRHGRFLEGCAEFEVVFSLEGANPRIKLDAGVIYALTFGQYAAARKTCAELVGISEHLGIDGRVVQVVALVDASTALLEGRDAHAEHVLRFIEPVSPMRTNSQSWYYRSLDIFRGVCAWRAGDAAGAAASFEGAFECWRDEAKTVTWPALLLISVLLDFALWWQSDTAAALSAALSTARPRPRARLGAVARLRALACGGSPRASVFDGDLEAERAHAARVVALDTASSLSAGARARRASAARLSDVDQGSSSDVDAFTVLERAAAPRGLRPSLLPPPPAPPAARGPGGDAVAIDVEALAGEAKQAAAFLRELGSLLEETCRRRLPNLAPCCDLLRAQRPGVPRARRLASLRAARDGFAAGGLRPFEALACMQLARAEADGEAASAALDAAWRIADETHTVIPALERLLADGAEAAAAPAPPCRESYSSLFV